MSKDIDLTNSLLSASHFLPLDGWAKKYSKYLIFDLYIYRSTSTEWILYLNVGGLYLSWKDSGSNLFGRTQVYLMCVRARAPYIVSLKSFPDQFLIISILIINYVYVVDSCQYCWLKH